MEMTVHNPQKGRLETIDASITPENTTWFENCQEKEICTITDLEGGLLIRELDYGYPLWVYDTSRADIGYDQQEADKIYRVYVPKG
jgi:hypothetical protein